MKNKFITITNHSGNTLIPDKNAKRCYVAGMNHVKSCLHSLLDAAESTGRTAILPPPWFCLQPHHNNNKEIDTSIFWDEYFELSELLSKGVIAPPNIRIHQRSGRIKWDTKSVEYVHPKKFNPKKLDDNVDIYAITFYNGGGIKRWSCMESHVGNKKWKENKKLKMNKPSKKINILTNKISKNLGTFNVIHIRSPYEPWTKLKDIPKNEIYASKSRRSIVKAIQVEAIKQFLTSNGISKKETLLVLYHFDQRYPDARKLKEYLSGLKGMGYNVIFEQEIPELNNDVLSYEVLKELTKSANKKICTVNARCFDECDLRLVSNVTEAYQPTVGNGKDDISPTNVVWFNIGIIILIAILLLVIFKI